MTDTVSLLNSAAILPAALAATDPILLKVRASQEKIVTMNVDIGKAFGLAIAAAHVEPLGFIAFCEAYQAPLQAHCQTALGYVSGNAVQVMLRTANLAAAGKAIPTRAAVVKKSGGTKSPLAIRRTSTCYVRHSAKPGSLWPRPVAAETVSLRPLRRQRRLQARQTRRHLPQSQPQPQSPFPRLRWQASPQPTVHLQFRRR